MRPENNKTLAKATSIDFIQDLITCYIRYISGLIAEENANNIGEYASNVYTFLRGIQGSEKLGEYVYIILQSLKAIVL
jgi:hypothetical protein